MNRKLLGTLAGFSALGIGIGLQRSQFAVLGELMANQQWFANSMIGELSGISLAGYILGCIHQTTLKDELKNIRWVRIGLAVAVLSFFIEPLIHSTAWQIAWRLIAGWSSAQLVTGVPSLGIRHHRTEDKRRALAYIFAGAGAAALAASLLVSLLASTSIVGSWDVTGAVAFVLAIPIYFLLVVCEEEERVKAAGSAQAGSAGSATAPAAPTEAGWSRALLLLAGSTLFFGAGQVTVLIYFPLLLVSQFSLSHDMAAAYFANVGLGYLIGAVAAGHMPKKISTDSLMTTSAVIGVLGMLVCSLASSVPIVVIGGFAFAFWNGSTMGLLLQRINESVPQERSRRVWSQFSLTLSVGFLVFTFISAPIANQNVLLIIRLGAGLATVHLALQLMARRAFATAKPQTP